MSIKAVIYDMDGVLIDSEPFWRIAEVETFLDVGLPFTEEMCKPTMGMRTADVIDYWFDKTPWSGKTKKEVELDMLQRVTQLINENGKELEGVIFSLNYFKNKGLKIALASSSAMSLIEAVLKKLQIKNYFEIINSAEYLNYGKPHPEIYIKTSKELKVNPDECLVIEDSLNGVLSAKSAMMKVIAIPDKENRYDKRFVIADHMLKSLNEVESFIIE